MFKKQCFILILFLTSFRLAVAQNGGISFFEGTLQQAIEKAKADNKLIFIDCQASWCGPCKRLASVEFTKTEMGNYFNSRFINLSVDMEDNDEGKAIRKRFDINYYPTLLLINPKGYKIKELIAGASSAEELIKWATSGLACKDTITLEQRFGEGNRKAVFLKAYFRELLDRHNERRIELVLDQMIKEKGYDALYERPAFDVIESLPVTSPIARYFFMNSGKFSGKFCPDEVAEKISTMYNSMNYYGVLYGPGPLREFYPKAYTAMLADMKSMNLPDFDFIKAEIDVFVALRKGGQETVYQMLQHMLVGAKPWQYHDAVKLANKYLLDGYRVKATSWAKEAIEMNDGNQFLRRQCELYFKELSTAKNAVIRDPAYPYEIVINL